MYAGKPIIGIVGGIGSGKSFVADLFGEAGCLVIKSDQQVYEAYRMDRVRRVVREWWGDAVFAADGEVDRGAIAARVFEDPEQRKRLEMLVHPVVGELRDELMRRHADDAAVVAYVWDTPLLFEVGLDKQCDGVVFVDCPVESRLERVGKHRGWAAEEFIRREKSQLALDKKRKMAHYIVQNTADAAYARRQVLNVLSRILHDRVNADLV